MPVSSATEMPVSSETRYTHRVLLPLVSHQTKKERPCRKVNSARPVVAVPQRQLVLSHRAELASLLWRVVWPPAGGLSQRDFRATEFEVEDDLRLLPLGRQYNIEPARVCPPGNLQACLPHGVNRRETGKPEPCIGDFAVKDNEFLVHRLPYWGKAEAGVLQRSVDPQTLRSPPDFHSALAPCECPFNLLQHLLHPRYFLTRPDLSKKPPFCFCPCTGRIVPYASVRHYGKIVLPLLLNVKGGQVVRNRNQKA